MANITKRGLIDRIVARTDLKRAVVKETLQAIIDTVAQEMSDGNRIEVRGFGVFEVKERAARQAQNPRTMQRFSIPPKRSVRFRPGRILKDCVCDDKGAAAGAKSSHDGNSKREGPIVELKDRVREHA